VVGAEEEIGPRREVAEVLYAIAAQVVPVVQLGRAQQHAQRAERQPHVRVDEDRPHSAQRDQPGDLAEREAEHERRRVDRQLRQQAVDGVLAVRGQPVQMLRAVVDGVKAPQDRQRVAGAMEPVDTDVAEHHHHHRLHRHRPGAEACPQAARNQRVDDAGVDGADRDGGEADPDQVLAGEERQVGPPARPEQRLAASRREQAFERPEHERQRHETDAGGPGRRGQVGKKDEERAHGEPGDRGAGASWG